MTIKPLIITVFGALMLTASARTTTTTTTRTTTDSDGTTRTVTSTETDHGPESDWKKYLPTVNGIFRGQYQQSTADGEGRFRVRNARLKVTGNVMPMVGYVAQVDLCDKGKMKILDMYITLRPAKGLSIMMGQERVPFSVESTRGPNEYHFTDISLVGKFGNLRSAGIKAGYRFAKCPLYFEGGVFNSSDLDNHGLWQHQLTYSIKGNYKTGCGLRPELAFMSRVPGATGIRINQYNASLSWTYGGFFVEGEYIMRLYTNDYHRTSHAWNFFVDYGWPVDWKWAQRMSVQARFDGMTEAITGFIDDNETDDLLPERKRLTLGTTASYNCGRAHLDFRLNYEKYFYPESVNGIKADDNDKLVASMILYF